jgi:hypothetical protein
MALGLLVAVGSGLEDISMGPESMEPVSAPYESFGGPGDQNGGRGDHFDDNDRNFRDHDGGHDFNRHDNFDWLNPGGYYSYSYWYYPSYSYYGYPSYTYTYPVTYSAPVVYPAYTYYYDPVAYDPWYAANVYGWTGTTYYYSRSWSSFGGYYFI